MSEMSEKEKSIFKKLKVDKDLETISGKLVNISSEIKKISQEILNILS